MGGSQAKRPQLPTDPSKALCKNEHSHLVLRGLHEQRQKGLFCDVVLVADGVRFSAHRNILAASSSYFNSMFTGGMLESFQNEVELIGASSVGFNGVLDFLYGNEVSLNGSIVDGVLKAAHLLQIGKLVDVCCEYLSRDLNEENYFELQELASTYNLEQLDLSIDCFILKNFGTLSFTPGFIEKISLEKLCFYLDSDQVQVNVEYDLLRGALKWLSHCTERAKESYEVLQNIRFSLIPESDLINLVKPAFCSLTQQMNCHSLFDEALHYHRNVTAQPVLQNRRSTLRAEGEQLLYFAAHYMELYPMKKDNVCFLDPNRGKWITETQLPDWRADFSVAVLGNFIFCAGGYADADSANNISNMVYRYDPRWKQWRQVAPMNHARVCFYLAALEDRLVAVGGDLTDLEVLSSVETYNPETDSWYFVSALPRPTSKHAGATYKQRVYVSGGTSEHNGTATKTLVCYDHGTDTWEEKMSMNTDRCLHSMCALDECIYAIGGAHGVDLYPYKSVECYSPLCDQWTTVAPLLTQTYFAGAAVWKGEIYVLGGTPYRIRTAMYNVQMYDHKENIWFEGSDLPCNMTGLAACVCVLNNKMEMDTNK